MSIVPPGNAQLPESRRRCSKIRPSSSTTTADDPTTTTVIAGNGTQGYNGNSTATSAELDIPSGLAVDGTGTVYIADTYNEIVDKVTPPPPGESSGAISIDYGTEGTAQLVANGGLYHPSGVAVDNSGNVYISDTLNCVVWKVTPGGTASVYAGSSQGQCGSGAGELNGPAGLAFDNTSGTLYIADQNNCRVVAVGGTGGYNAGNGTCGYSGDGSQATSAELNYPTSVAVANGILYIADTNNNRIREVYLSGQSAGYISTFAGTGGDYNSGNGGPATSASVQSPDAVTADPAGDVFIATGSGSIREVNTSGVINFLDQFSGTVISLAVDGSDNVYAGVGYPDYEVYEVSGFWPPSQYSNSAVTIEAPAASDAPYTRQISIGLSNSGIQEYQYGWSTTNTTAPPNNGLQVSTDTTHNTGTLNYLGVYSGSGTTWYGSTTPDSDYYLWIRSVNTDGSDNAWATPLLVHTPKQPIWVSVGDSYSSGWNQSADEPIAKPPLASTGRF